MGWDEGRLDMSVCVVCLWPNRLSFKLSLSINLARPVSGAFSLDLDKIESKTERMSDIGPKLIEHNLEDIMNSEPIMLPVTR